MMVHLLKMSYHKMYFGNLKTGMFETHPHNVAINSDTFPHGGPKLLFFHYKGMIWGPDLGSPG